MFLALAGNKKIIAWHLLVHAIVAVLIPHSTDLESDLEWDPEVLGASKHVFLSAFPRGVRTLI